MPCAQGRGAVGTRARATTEMSGASLAITLKRDRVVLHCPRRPRSAPWQGGPKTSHGSTGSANRHPLRIVYEVL